MKIYTIEPIIPDASKFEPRPEVDTIFRLRVNGKLKRIAFTAEEAADLQRNGPIIGRSALEELFSSIPFDPRLAMLRRIPTR